MKITLEAIRENASKVNELIEQKLEEIGCSPRVQYQVSVAVDEVFSNIINYAYAGRTPGTATIDFDHTNAFLTIIFTDSGVPYNPLEREDPDVTLAADKRQVGGLGIFLVKKLMDEVEYKYENGQNILTLRKYLPGSDQDKS